MANRTKTPTWKYQKDRNCSNGTFQGWHHVSEHTKGCAGDSGGVIVTCEDRPCASKESIGGNGGKLFGYIFTVSTLKFALDNTLESFQKICVLRWEMNSLSDWFSISFLAKKN